MLYHSRPITLDGRAKSEKQFTIYKADCGSFEGVKRVRTSLQEYKTISKIIADKSEHYTRRFVDNFMQIN